MQDPHHQVWLENPEGKVPRGQICPACARYNARNIACVSIALRDYQVAMILRKYPPMDGYWALPGGYLDWNETTAECAAREFTEETGMKGTNSRLFGVYSDPGIDQDGRQNVGIFYLLDASGTPEPGDDALEVAWFDLHALPEKIAFNHRQVIEDFLNSNFCA